MAEPRAERRNARPDRDLVHHQERGADPDVCPDNAAQARGERCKDSDLDNDAAGHDPGVPCLASREVVADQDVGNREQTDRKSKGSKHAASLGEALAKCRRDEPWTRGRVEEHEQPTERRSGEQRTSEDVLRLLAARLTRGSARKQNREDSRGQKEADAREGGGSGVCAGLVSREARLDDEYVDVGEEGDAYEADGNRAQVAQERHELLARQRAWASQWLPNK